MAPRRGPSRDSKTTPRIARVFISSTRKDLEEYCARAKEAALDAGLQPEMMEHWTATGSHPPLEECLAKVRDSDVVVVIVAHRYGWKPPDGGGKSVTRLECEEAARLKKEILAFIVDDKCDWPELLRDRHRIALAAETDDDTPELQADVKQDMAGLRDFKKWLDENYVRVTFSNPEELHRKVHGALTGWRGRHPELAGAREEPETEEADPSEYLRQLTDQCSWIDIRGLQVGSGKAHRFPIDQLYIPLTIRGGLPSTAARRPKHAGKRGGQKNVGPVQPEPVALEEALQNPRLVIVGDPGAGKTTFLRHIALARVKDFKRRAPAAPFPILISVSALLDFIGRHKQPELPDDSPRWLERFLAWRSEETSQGLTAEFFAERIKTGDCLLLLDGLDEAPDALRRESAVRLFESQAFRNCRMVVTTRPQSYTGRSVLADFAVANIEPLETDAVATFLARWCAALFPEGGAPAKGHLSELTQALCSVPEIRRMARNPVMLTALAVVHWNDRRLPEQRADLYESVLNWLARSRETRLGRESADRCLLLLQHLALAMQTQPQGRQTRIERGLAAEALMPLIIGSSTAERRQQALAFVEQEEVDSGIIVSRGSSAQFWHLTFQEYLAARAIAGLEENDQRGLLLEEDRLYRSEWREMVLLLAGVLCVKQGPAKVEGLFRAVLDRLGPNAPLAAKARCAGLLGSMVNDLRPLDYQPLDPRYRDLMDSVLGVFDRKKSAGVDFAVRLEAAEALGQAGDPRIGRDNWVRIEGGTFPMREPPGRKTKVKTFEIGRFPVTVQEYRKFVEDGGYSEARWWKEGGSKSREQPGRWDEQIAYPNRPVTDVSWHEATAYAAWANARLPSGAEWEFAARGSEGRTYSWGNEPPDADRANYYDSGPKKPTPVGLYPTGATPEGVLDMTGNVEEWVDEWADEEHEARVLRGGSWYSYQYILGAAERNRYGPENGFFDIGFRLARDVFVP